MTKPTDLNEVRRKKLHQKLADQDAEFKQRRRDLYATWHPTIAARMWQTYCDCEDLSTSDLEKQKQMWNALLDKQTKAWSEPYDLAALDAVIDATIDEFELALLDQLINDMPDE